MTLKAKLFGLLLVIIVIALGVTKINSVFADIKELTDSNEQLKEDNTRLENEKKELDDKIADLLLDQQFKDNANEQLRYENSEIDKSYDALKNELVEYRKNHPAVTKETVPVEPTDTFEADLAWRAYCKSRPAGCPQGAAP